MKLSFEKFNLVCFLHGGLERLACLEPAALKHRIRNPETETESRKRNTESNINDRKLKNFTLHNLVQPKQNLF